MPPTTCTFFRLLHHDDKAAALRQAIDDLRDQHGNADTHVVDPASFEQVPGSPFAYWISARIRQLFHEWPSFETEDREVKTGLSTGDDYRFVRMWWEVEPRQIVTGTSQTTLEQFNQQTFTGKCWSYFARGGESRSFYSDLSLVVNWGEGGREIYAKAGIPYGGAGAPIRNPSYYFRSGLTWSLRAAKFAPSALPSGSIFSVRGYAILASPVNLRMLNSLGNSTPFDFLFKVMLGRFGFPEFIVGIVQQLPIPTVVMCSRLA